MTTKKFLDKDGLAYLWSKLVVTSDVQTQTISGSFGVTVKAYKRLGIVMLDFAQTGSQKFTQGSWNDICTLPEEYWPAKQFNGMVIDNGTNRQQDIAIYIRVTEDGLVRAWRYGDKLYANDMLYGDVVYIAKTNQEFLALKGDPIDVQVNGQSVVSEGIATLTVPTNLKNGSTTGSVKNIYSSTEDSYYRIGAYAFAEGKDTKATGIYSHAEGYNTQSNGSKSHAEGSGTVASGDNSHAEGAGAVASGGTSHAEGSGTASGLASHAEGSGTVASDDYSHAEGHQTQAGFEAHAEGAYTKATGNCSHAGGYETIAACRSQTAIGELNKQDPDTGYASERGKYAFIIGNGYEDFDEEEQIRSNALTVDWDGNVETSGYITIDSIKGIQYKGTKATYDMIRFLDNTADAYGNGVVVGNGGVAMLTAGESYDTLATASQPYTAGSETAVIASDSEIDLWTNLNSGLSSGKRVKINNQGQVIQPYIALTKTYASNTAVNETAFNRINAVKVGNIIVVNGNLTLTGSLASGTTVKIGTINGMGTVILTASQAVPVHGSTTMINISVAANGDITLYNYGSSAITTNPWVRFDCCLVASN